MSQQEQNHPDNDQLKGSVAAFAAFCESEFERRRNTAESFDEQSYRQAMEMTLRRLRTLEQEGRA